MMRQFEHVVTQRTSYLLLVNTDKWDYFWGFRIYIKELHES